MPSSVCAVIRPPFLALVLAAALCAGCSAAGTDRTDETVRLAVDDLPPSDTVLGHVHAIRESALGAGEQVDVLMWDDFGDDGLGRVLVRTEDPETTGIFSGRDAVLACYEVELEAAGALRQPRRTSCPEGGGQACLLAATSTTHDSRTGRSGRQPGMLSHRAARRCTRP